MKRLASFLSIAASSAFLFWATVAPSGSALCSSNTEFNYHPLTEAGHAAGIAAKVQFCKTVKSHAL